VGTETQRDNPNDDSRWQMKPYRPLAPREEEIARIHDDGIYRSPYMVERSGVLEITGRIYPGLAKTTSSPTENRSSDEPLRDSSTQPSSFDYPYDPMILRYYR